MNTQPSDSNLKRFQDGGGIDSLLRFVEITGRDAQKFKAALDDLRPVLKGLSFGWRPRYQDLDLTALRQRMAEITDIVGWMAGSSKADMKSTAIELMGILHWDSFVPFLRQHFSSDAAWERLTVIGALGQFTGEWTSEILRTAAEHDPDPNVRDAARQQLQARLP